MKSWMKKRPVKTFLLLVLTGFLAFEGLVYNHHLSFIPDGMKVWRIVYSYEKTRGFGPGSNEAGIIAYALPDSTAKAIERDDIKYFSTLPQRVRQHGDSRHGIYKDWYRTPLNADWVNAVIKQESLVTPYTTGIANYLSRSGFLMPIDHKIEQKINKSISESGSFYAHGRTGLIIVAPRIRRVFYVYVG